MREKDHSSAAAISAWKVLTPIGAIGVLMAIWFHVWQDDVRDLIYVAHWSGNHHPLAGTLRGRAVTVVEFGQFTRRRFILPTRKRTSQRVNWPNSTTEQHDQRQDSGQRVVIPVQMLDAHQVAHAVLPDVEPDRHEHWPITPTAMSTIHAQRAPAGWNPSRA